jgi:hypothetical protein
MPHEPFYCSKCGEEVTMDFRSFRFEHDHTKPGVNCAGGPVSKIRPTFITILGEVVEDDDEVEPPKPTPKDEYALARPFTASAQPMPKSYGGPYLR